VADPVEVDHWHGDGIRLSAVISALADLRDQSAAHFSSARTAALTLVAVAGGDEEAYGATGALRILAGHHPSRILIVRPQSDSVAHLEARATLYALDNDRHRMNFEEVRLDVGGQAALHLDSLVEAFTLSDLPVVVWYVNSIPDPSDPLASIADAILIDSRDAPDPGQLRSVLQLARRRAVVDLSWFRLRPWRELLAGLFEPPGNRELLEQISSVAVAGKIGPRRLIGGWVAAQTGCALRRVSLHDDRHLNIRITAGAASFTVERVEGQRLVAAEASLADGSVLRATSPLPDDPLGTSLADALTHLGPDPVWERALSTATALD
jgi:glucose-6-phosphate dehydrogenase assembly protein OpcA